MNSIGSPILKRRRQENEGADINYSEKKQKSTLVDDLQEWDLVDKNLTPDLNSNKVYDSTLLDLIDTEVETMAEANEKSRGQQKMWGSSKDIKNFRIFNKPINPLNFMVDPEDEKPLRDPRANRPDPPGYIPRYPRDGAKGGTKEEEDRIRLSFDIVRTAVRNQQRQSLTFLEWGKPIEDDAITLSKKVPTFVKENEDFNKAISNEDIEEDEFDEHRVQSNLTERQNEEDEDFEYPKRRNCKRRNKKKKFQKNKMKIHATSDESNASSSGYFHTKPNDSQIKESGYSNIEGLHRKNQAHSLTPRPGRKIHYPYDKLDFDDDDLAIDENFAVRINAVGLRKTLSAKSYLAHAAEASTNVHSFSFRNRRTSHRLTQESLRTSVKEEDNNCQKSLDSIEEDNAEDSSILNETVLCPMCNDAFHKSVVERHAYDCQGPVSDSMSAESVKSECYICNQLIVSQNYLSHVERCIEAKAESCNKKHKMDLSFSNTEENNETKEKEITRNFANENDVASDERLSIPTYIPIQNLPTAMFDFKNQFSTNDTSVLKHTRKRKFIPKKRRCWKKRRSCKRF